MRGRPIFSENDERFRAARFGGAEAAQRRLILKETLKAFSDAEPPERYAMLARDNLKRWRDESQELVHDQEILVLPGDWGEVTLSLTRKYGACFAVLNMANAYVPGGAYVEGAAAQEENMFRRTDCHFSISEQEYDAGRDRYHKDMTRLLSAGDGRVYLDTDRARVCIRGREDRSRPDLGYSWLADNQIFPFFELRASAQDLRDGSPFDVGEARRRIAAQFDTLESQGVRHAVLGAFGCGAFRNPATVVARLYKEELNRRAGEFTVIAFAIYAAGYGPDNYPPFAEALSDDGIRAMNR